MRNYENVIKENRKNPKFYIPVINLFKKSKKPLSIKEVAKSLNISYSAAKPRLHKLAKLNIVKGMKRGYYCLSSIIDEYTKMALPNGRLVFLNGCIRVMGSSNGVWITVYNSKFGEFTKGQYCRVEDIGKNKFVIRKSNEFYGSKLHFLISKSVGLSIARKFLPENIVLGLSSKVTPIKIGIYLDEWGLTIKDIFSTEAKEEGELAEELDKFGEIEKKNKFDDFKADIIFTKNKIKVPIEITITNPSSIGRFKESRRSGVKSSLILERLYFFIKWNFIYKSPTVLIIHKDWLKFGWVRKEQEFMRRFNCNILFTDFKTGWVKQVAQEINRLTE